MAALRHGESRWHGLQWRSGARCELRAMKSGAKEREGRACAHRGVVSSREDPLGGRRRTPAASMAWWSRTGRCGDLPVVWAPREGVTLRCEHNRGSERAETCRRRGNCSELRAYRSWGSARFRRCSDLGPTPRIRRASWFFSRANAGVVGARVAAEQCGHGSAVEWRHSGAIR